MGPSLLFDKSAFESLSRDEHISLTGHFLFVLPPVLVAEVIADLKKDDPSAQSSEELVQRLARKFLGSGPPLHVGHALLLRNDLMGSPITMDGRSYPAGTIEVPDQGLGAGAYVPVSPTNEAILRWGYGEFRDNEREVAQAWRSAKLPFPVSQLKTSLSDRGVAIPRLGHISEVTPWVRSLLDNPDLASLWLDWLCSKVTAWSWTWPSLWQRNPS
jgi:hypothetical protein